MRSPFDDVEGTFLVLANDEGDRCLWPGFADVPAGWTVERPAAPRAAALAHVASAAPAH